MYISQVTCDAKLKKIALSFSLKGTDNVSANISKLKKLMVNNNELV